jgi:glycerol-3-phosphate acyltransferase PlsY
VDGWTETLLVIVASYLLGSIPFGILVTRLGGAADPRTLGSGNIGATNVLRTGRKGLAAATLLLDGGKGAAAVAAAAALAPGLEPLAGLLAFLGHLFPVWLRGSGGKGVATMLGTALALFWPCGVAALLLWLGATLASRYSSVGGISAAMVLPVTSAMFFRADLTLVFLIFALMVLWRHSANIGRLLDGTEPRLTRRTSG